MGKDTFLKLLVAQLKYQNPMSPTDGTQFLAQSAQFTMVEKLEEMEKQMTSLVGMQQRIEASGLIGKDVTFHDATTDKDIDGIVTSVDFAGATPSVKVGGKDVPISDLTGVTTPTAPAPTTPTAPAPTPPAGSTTTPTSTSSGS
jgi:flagellar basal-body rod modification protein FlgD